jgi:hypothetical protein
VLTEVSWPSRSRDTSTRVSLVSRVKDVFIMLSLILRSY